MAGTGGIAGVVAQRGGEVDGPGPAEHLDHQVAQAGDDVGVGTGTDLGGVLGEGGIPEVRALLHTIGRYRTIGQIERTPEPWCPPEASAGPEGRYRSSPLRKRSAASSSRRARDS
jgi:hypothetical protein